LDTTPQDNPQLTPQVETLLGILQGEMSRSELMAALGLSDRKSFRERYLQPALQAGLIEMTIPDKPNSRLQKYRLVSMRVK
ncbi:Fic family protein, partial [Thiolapillus sp.]